MAASRRACAASSPAPSRTARRASAGCVGGAVDRDVEQHLDLPLPRDPRERPADVGHGVEAVGGGEGCVVSEGRGRWDPVDPEHAQLLAAVVVRREVPATAVHHEPVRAELALRLLALERPVLGAPAPSASADRVGEQEDGLSALPWPRDLLRGREAERWSRALRPRPRSPVGKDAVELRQRALRPTRRRSIPSRGAREQAEDDDDRLVVAEHQRWQPEAGAHVGSPRRRRAGPRRGCRAPGARRRNAAPCARRPRAARPARAR